MNKKVVGVSFDDGDSAPTVVLKGAGAQAETLLSQARGLQAKRIVKNAELTRELYRVPIDTPVGRELFPVMAALIVHIMQVDEQHRVGESS